MIERYVVSALLIFILFLTLVAITACIALLWKQMLKK